MTDLFLDTETKSTVPIQRGTDAYTRNATCLLYTYAFNEAPVQYWEPWDQPKITAQLEDGLLDERVRKIAHHANFDRSITRHALGIETPIESWHCTVAQAYAHGLPGSLEVLGRVLGLPHDQQKLVEDGKLIHTFCIEQEGGQYIQPWARWDDWLRFRGYGIQDTATLREIFRRLPRTNYEGIHLQQWYLDQHINQRGFGFDRDFARAAVDFLDAAKNRVDGELTKATDGAVTAATQRNRLLAYLNDKYGAELESLRASDLRAMLEQDDLRPEVRWLVETRLEAGKSSGSKYRKGIGALGPGDRLRCCVQFNGAGRSGRFSHRLFQPGNMARPVLTVRKEFGPDAGKVKLEPVEAKFIDEIIMPGIRSGDALNFKEVYGGPNEAAALALRHVIKAALGNELVVADWSNIESRVLAWIAREDWKLEAYRARDRGEGEDLYRLLFASFFGVDPKVVNDNERQSGKVSELAFGFGGGVGALVTMAAGYQMDLDPLADIVLPRATPEQLKKAHKAWRRAFLLNEDYGLDSKVFKACDVLKQTYREANAKIDQLKRDVDEAVKAAVREPGRWFHLGRCTIWCDRAWLIIQLPSGRRLLYSQPKVETEVDIDPDTLKPIHREFVSYSTARGKSWRREKAWAGLFIENIVQAIANDILRAGLLALHEDTWTVPAIKDFLMSLHPDERTAISLHVHDEAVLDVPKGSYPLVRMLRVLGRSPSWGEDIPLVAEGWVGPVYGKRKGKSLNQLLKVAA